MWIDLPLFEGDTGPYILYTIVRIKSILSRYTEEGQEVQKGENLPGGKRK